MDGREAFQFRSRPFSKKLSERFARGAMLLAIVAALLLPRVAFAQAMGQVALDAPATAPGVGPAGGAAAIVPGPATAVISGSQAKSAVPLPVAAPGGATTLPATVESAPQMAAKSPLTPERAAGDSMPADPAQAVAPLRAIEHQEIRPHSVPVVAGTPPSPAANSSSSPGIWSALQVAAALAVVIGLVFIGKALARRFLPGAKAGNGKGVIEILARYPMAKNQSLVLVRIGSQIVTLNQGKDQSHSVLVISDPNEVAKIVGQIEGTSPNSIQSGFNRLLANARMDLETGADDEKEDFEASSMKPQNLDSELDEMAAAKRQLMELRQQVRSVRDSLPR